MDNQKHTVSMDDFEDFEPTITYAKCKTKELYLATDDNNCFSRFVVIDIVRFRFETFSSIEDAIEYYNSLD